MSLSNVYDMIGDKAAEWIALRRDFHRFPELGFLEFRTASRVAARLTEIGFEVRCGRDVMVEAEMTGRPEAGVTDEAQELALANGGDGSFISQMTGGLTGVVGEMRKGAGPVVAVRFDMDALPITEADDNGHLPAREGFASMRPGVMHSCAHDMHTSIGLAVAELAASEAVNWAGTLRLIFQPAEEGGRGAKPMAEAGIVDDADWFFSLHMGCDLPGGQVAASAVDMMHSVKWDVTLQGKSAHAAGNPEDGRNALLAAAQAALGLHGIARHGTHKTHVNVGTLAAGAGRNIIADHASMQLELRGDCDDALAYMEARAKAVIDGAAQSFGCGQTVTVVGRTIGETSTDGAIAAVTKAAGNTAGIDRVLGAWRLGGGDDAAYFMRRVKQNGGEAAYFIVGSDLPDGHHTPHFNPDEDDMIQAVRVCVRILEETMSGGPG